MQSVRITVTEKTTPEVTDSRDIVCSVKIRGGSRNGQSLPARWYADPDTLEREQELVFRCNWQYAGRADQVAEPGSFITTSAGLVPLAVVRGGDGSARGNRNHPDSQCDRRSA